MAEDRKQKVAEYNRTYYEKNRERIRKKRYERYHNNPNYRKKVKRRQKEYYNKYLKSPDPSKGYTIKKHGGKELFTIQYLAEILGYSESSIRKFEADGILPESVYTDRRGWRYYSSAQIDLCVKAFGERRAGRWSDEEVKNYLASFWKTEPEEA